MFPILKRPAPLLELLRGQRVAVTPETPLTEAQRKLAESFKVGIALALGVPPEAIRQESIERWIREWTKAFVRPEWWAQVSVDDMERLGRMLGEIVKEARK
ncbi:MAG: hypothetical protein QW356_04670 [Candidatus Hadarchaeales archaeon]